MLAKTGILSARFSAIDATQHFSRQYTQDARIGGGSHACFLNSSSHAKISFGTKKGISRQQKSGTVQCQASYNNDDKQGNKIERPGSKDGLIIYGTAAALTAVSALSFTLFREPFEDLLYGGGLDLFIGDVTLGDITAAIFWSFSLYFVSPLQLLLLFLGQIETDRPSDWVLYQLGKAAGYPVDSDPAYSAPANLRAATYAVFVGGGIVTAWLFHAALGGATWGVSSGIGSLFAAGVYEVGRPTRMDPEEAKKLEEQWQVFAGFADERLQRVGNCHESEVFKAFRTEFNEFRNPAVLSDVKLRTMVRQWAPQSDRTTNGFLKNVSVKPRVDPFTGKMSGSSGLSETE